MLSRSLHCSVCMHLDVRLNHVLCNQQRKIKPWLGGRHHSHGCWGADAPRSVLASDVVWGAMSVSRLPAVCLNKVVKLEHSTPLVNSCQAVGLLRMRVSFNLNQGSARSQSWLTTGHGGEGVSNDVEK